MTRLKIARAKKSMLIAIKTFDYGARRDRLGSCFFDLPPPASSGFCCRVESSRTGLDPPADWAWLGEQMFAPEQQVPQTGTKRLRSKPGACAGTDDGQ